MPWTPQRDPDEDKAAGESLAVLIRFIGRRITLGIVGTITLAGGGWIIHDWSASSAQAAPVPSQAISETVQTLKARVDDFALDIARLKDQNVQAKQERAAQTAKLDELLRVVYRMQGELDEGGVRSPGSTGKP